MTKMTILVLMVLVGCAQAFLLKPSASDLIKATKVDNEPVTLGQSLVNSINSRTKLFTARRYSRFEGLELEELKSFLGAQRDPEAEAVLRKKREAGIVEVDEEEVNDDGGLGGGGTGEMNTFDINEEWPQCAKVFNQIQDQSNCGSCWAVSTASVITDRRCIRYNGTTKPRISSWDLVGCCANCKADPSNGCNGGYTNRVFDHYVANGVVTGGAFGGNGCKPYQVAPGEPNQPLTTPCVRQCQSAYTASTYANDKKKGGVARIFSLNNTLTMREIKRRGSVVAQFAVYQDFYQYSSGVYMHTTGSLVGYHAVRITGWGFDQDLSVPYWKVANSWGKAWGENGFFRIVLGQNECGFEEWVVSATALKD